MKVNFDPAVTLMANALWHVLAAYVGDGYRTVEFRKIFGDLDVAHTPLHSLDAVNRRGDSDVDTLGTTHTVLPAVVFGRPRWGA